MKEEEVKTFILLFSYARLQNPFSMTNNVNNWLYDAGLNHAVLKIGLHRISNASDTVKLKIAGCASLGIVDSYYRKKLHFLTQRIKMEIGKESSSNHNKSNEEFYRRRRNHMKNMRIN